MIILILIQTKDTQCKGFVCETELICLQSASTVCFQHQQRQSDGNPMERVAALPGVIPDESHNVTVGGCGQAVHCGHGPRPNLHYVPDRTHKRVGHDWWYGHFRARDASD